MRLKPFLCCTSLLVLLALPSAAEPLAPRGEVSVKGGTDRSLLTTEFWAPLAQRSDRVLYGDIRLMGDNDENREGNLGLGYRQIKNDAVLGVHGWIDRRRTQHNSTFHQLTFGVERLGHIVDARANVYIPINQGRTITTRNIGVTSPYLAGSGIYYDTNGSISETPQYGVDGELGYRLPIFQKQADAIRVYGGGYYFFRDNTIEVPGARFRTEAQINKAVSIGARVQYDKPRGTQGFLEATLKFPFSAKRLYQESGIRSRLDESPERDVDIVTESKVTDTGLFKPVINAATGTQQRILYVDNTKADGGNGSYEKPFNSLKTAEAALQNHDIVYINRGDGTTRNMSQGIVIDKRGVSLIGSGSALTYGGFTLLQAGAAPVITNTQASSSTYVNNAHIVTGDAVFVTGSDFTIKGLTLNGASRSGLYVLMQGGAASSLIDVSNLTATNNIGTGVEIRTHNSSRIDAIHVENVISNNNGLAGISANNGANSNITNVRMVNVTANSNTAVGLGIISNGAILAKMQSAIISDFTASSNQRGVYIQVGQGGTNTGYIGSVDISNGLLENNAIDGVNITAGVSGVGSAIDRVELKSLTLNASATKQTNAGILVSTSVSPGLKVVIENNILTGGAKDGINAGPSGTAVLTDSIIRNNSISQMLGIGIKIGGGSTSNTTYSILDNTIQNNQQHGLFFNPASTSNMAVKVQGNNITDNGNSTSYYGIQIDNDSTGTVNIDLGGGTLGSTGNNRIYSNVYRDVYVDSRPGTVATTPGVTISAQNNWWGVNTGLNQGTRAGFDNGSASPGSSIDATNHLTTDPRP